MIGKILENPMEFQMASLNSKYKFKDLLHTVDPITNDSAKYEIHHIWTSLSLNEEGVNCKSISHQPGKIGQANLSSNPTKLV